MPMPPDSRRRRSPYKNDRSNSGFTNEDIDLRANKHNSSIMLRGIDVSTTEDRIKDYLNPFGTITEIRIPRDPRTGNNKGIAFAEYENPSEAASLLTRYLRDNRSSIEIDRKIVEIKFARPKNSTNYRPDWTCIKCNGVNFSSRLKCWTCSAPRATSEAKTTEKETAGLKVSGLDLRTPESVIIRYFEKYNQVKSCRLLRDNSGNLTGEAIVDLYSVQHARMNLLKDRSPTIDGRRVHLTYAPPELMNNQNHGNDYNSHDRYDSKQQTRHNDDYGQNSYYNHMPNDPTPQMIPKNHPFFLLGVPDEKDYVFDEAKNGYFNNNTNFYFDADSGYFYETTTGHYYYYDALARRYVRYGDNSEQRVAVEQPIPQAQTTADSILSQVQAQMTQRNYSTNTSISNTINNGNTSSSRSNRVKDDVVAKNIDKWNKKSEELAGQTHENRYMPTQPQSVPQSIPEPKQIQPQPVPQSIPESFDGDDDGEDISDVITKLKAKYEVVTGNICLLCKRNLGTTDRLSAHFQMSKLHAENLAKAAEQQLQEQTSLPAKRTPTRQNNDEPPQKRTRY